MKLPENIQKPRPRQQVELRLDANELPFNTPDNRYADERELLKLKQNWGLHERIPAECVYLCNGTEEAVDLTMRIFALPGRDNVVAATPTRHVYSRRAAINRLEYREAALQKADFTFVADDLLNVVSGSTKLIYLCSPNSPTGNLFSAKEIELVLQLFDGMVVVDESYVDFIPEATILGLLNKYKHLIILRSFSHAWSAAGLHLAAVVAHPEVIENFERIGFTHPLSSPVIRAAEELVRNRLDVDKWVRQIVDERVRVSLALRDLPECTQVYPSVANFVLARFVDSMSVYKYLLKAGIAVSPVEGCLRLSIGLPSENAALLGALRRRK